MSDTSTSPTELVAEASMTASAQPQPDVTDPAKLIRLGTMLQTMLNELSDTEHDDAGVQRQAEYQWLLVALAQHLVEVPESHGSELLCRMAAGELRR